MILSALNISTGRSLSSSQVRSMAFTYCIGNPGTRATLVIKDIEHGKPYTVIVEANTQGYMTTEATKALNAKLSWLDINTVGAYVVEFQEVTNNA